MWISLHIPLFFINRNSHIYHILRMFNRDIHSNVFQIMFLFVLMAVKNELHKKNTLSLSSGFQLHIICFKTSLFEIKRNGYTPSFLHWKSNISS